MSASASVQPSGVLKLPTAARGKSGAVPSALATHWLAALCRQIPGAEQGIAFLDAGANSLHEPSAYWPEDTRVAPGLNAVAEHALTQAGPVVHAQDQVDDKSLVRIACPITVAGQAHGVVAVNVSGLAEHQHGVVMQILQWGSIWLELLLEQRSAPATARLPALMGGLEEAFAATQFVPAALAVVSYLAHHLSFERVSLGQVRHRHVELVAVSDSPSASRRTSFAQALEQAMAEAVDANAVLVYPDTAGAEHSAHDALARQSDALAMCSVPLYHGGQPFAVLTFERVSDHVLDADSVQLCSAIGTAVGPMLYLKRMQNRSWWSHIGDALVGSASERGATFIRVCALLLVLAGAAFLSTASGEYRITAPATVQGRVQRAVVAPFDGFVDSATARAGDRVTAGMLLARLDDDTLLLEQRKSSSQRDELEKQYRRALADRDRAESSVLEARIGQTAAESELLAAQLARTELRAPFDGVVVSGDLSRALGAPVTRGQVLFEVAPLHDYRIVLDVDERDMQGLKVGLRGILTLSSAPNTRIPIRVQKIATSAQDSQGRNVVQVEAKLKDPSDAKLATLRPGMHGIAKVSIGEHRLLWIWTHPLVDWARLALWSGLP